MQPEWTQANRHGHRVEVDSASAHVIDSEKKQVVVKFGKKLSATDIQKYAALLVADPAFRPDFAEIVDLRDVEELDLQADDFFRLADHVDPFSPTAKRAFVVQNEVQHHAARMHKILRTQQNIGIFRTIEEAEGWIQE